MKFSKKNLILIVGLLLVLFHTGCDDSKTTYFEEGEFVRTKLDNRRGQIVRSRGWHMYEVRFVVDQITTKTHLLSSDSPISYDSYSLVEMKNFELIRDTEETEE